MSFSYMQPSAPKQNDKQQKATPYQQAPQQAGQQASPFSAPDMSAYSGTPPKGARVNDLSGKVPANQIWAQAYNQASKQFGGNTQAQSWTMPGSYTSQSYNPNTGKFSDPTGGQSWDGNMAYNAIDRRPSPIQAQATGISGNQMQWQDAMAQREAFVGNLSQRLNQYNAGQLTGPVTFDQSQLLAQADEQLANGTFFNPFSQAAASQRAPQNPMPTGNVLQQNPDVQRAMDNATQYMQGNFQNPFGNSPQANNPQPTWGQQSYDPMDLQASPQTQVRSNTPSPVSAAQPVPPPAQGTPYNPQAQPQRLPPVPSAPAKQDNVFRPRPQVDAPPIRAPRNMKIVPPNRRGRAARFGGLRQNGDNRR